MEKIIVVDFGGQYSHLIASCVRKLGAGCELWQPETALENFSNPEIRGVIFSGGPASVYDAAAPQFNAAVFFEKIRVPVLGICYGHQLIAQAFTQKGAVEKQPGSGEYGPTNLRVVFANGILNGLSRRESVLMSHEDNVRHLPPGFMALARTSSSPYAVIQHIWQPIFGVQFHPEVPHTPCGVKIFENFLQICQVKKEWTPERIYEEAKKMLLEGVADKYAVIFVSGGVDSSVLLELARQNLVANKIIAIHIDTGLGEENAVKGFDNILIIDARSRFFDALREVYDPEKKREIIGNLFIEIWQEEVRKLDLPLEKCALLQGTIYPDTIETARTKHSDKIKTHHNRVPKIKEIEKVVEPLQYLYKDEVRMLGRMLGVEESILVRHPQPGPGDAVRILCSQYYLWPPFDQKLEKALAAEIEIINFCQKQSLKAFLLPLLSTGVQGDQRTYAYTIALKTETEDKSPPAIWELLLETASRITNSYKGAINRVVLTIYSKYPTLNMMGLRKDFVTEERSQLTKTAKAIVEKHLIMGNWYPFVWQFPVVLAPLSFDLRGESIILRPIDSVNGMTASAHRLPWPMVENMAREILKKIPGIQAIFYDLTSKPPGTIEWN